MKKVFRDYAEVKASSLEGYKVERVTIGINAQDTGLLMELERTIDNVTIGIDLIYNPDHENDETEFMISEEYMKHIEKP